MAANITTFLSDKLLDHAVGDVAYTKPTCFLALFTTVPTMPAGTGGVEPSTGSYARVALAGLWSAASAEVKSNNATISFPAATANWGTILGAGIWDALTVGNLLWAGALQVSQVINSGSTFSLSSGQLTAALA